MFKLIKRTVFLLILIAACALIATGCNKEESDNNNQKTDGDKQNTEKSVDLKDLEEAMLAADTTLPEMSKVFGSDENGPDLFSYLAEYDYEKVEDYFLTYAATGTAEEIAVIRLKDKDDAKDCLKAVEKHVEGRIIQFNTYDPSQVERCEAAVVFSNENYVVLIICDNSKDVKEAFYNEFK
ncbi:MAG: DUF4358 domain-containing protein [Lachnospiraceae bacterium]